MSVQVPVNNQFVNVVNMPEKKVEIDIDQTSSQSSNESTISFGEMPFKKQHVFTKLEGSAFSFIKKRFHGAASKEGKWTKSQKSEDKKVAFDRPIEVESSSESEEREEEGEIKEGIKKEGILKEGILLHLRGGDLLLKKRRGKEIRKGEMPMPGSMGMPRPMPKSEPVPVPVSTDVSVD